MKTINLNLTLDETNAILRTLSTQPYSQVAPIITKISQQAQPQLEEPKKEEPVQP